MPPLFRRQSNIQCFFCQAPTHSIPRNPRNFRCPTCGCWNRYDDKGEIISDEPAMHDEQLNSKSFSKRASPSKDRLPTMYGPGPFCHTCQTNQMLLVNLLSNYLPPPDSPEYASRVEMLPAYRESLHVRYPPMCESCRPAVEEEIERRNRMARTSVLGGWLQETKGKEKKRRVSGPIPEKENITTEMMLWRIRGGLWAASLAILMGINSCGAFGYRPLPQLSFLQPILPLLVLVSLLWTAWDPTYSVFRKSRIQGREVRIKGKKQYIVLQMTVWAFRLVSSVITALRWHEPQLDYLHFSEPTSFRSRLYFSIMLLIELVSLITSSIVLRVQHPPAIRLIDTNAHSFTSSRSATPNPSSRAGTPALAPQPTASEHDILAALSLSSKPVITPVKPVFGLPSLLSTLPPADKPEEEDPDIMDTSPDGIISPAKGKQKAGEDDASWLRPQRFFAPEKPTGLEGLFERTKLDDDAAADDVQRRKNGRADYRVWNWYWVYALSLVPLAAVAYKAWSTMKNGGLPLTASEASPAS